jgi:hypothetical protein
MCMSRRHLPLVRPPGGLPPDDQPAGRNIFQQVEDRRRKPPPPAIRTGRQVGPMAPASPQVAQEFDRRYRATGRDPAGPFRL